MTWLGSLPLSRSNVALFLLEHGFIPDELPYLAGLVRRLMEKHVTALKRYLNPRVGCSTYVFAVADPIGCLKPGEIHLTFSESFVDQQSGFCDMMLHRIDLVVARQPALRGSDIQKVQAVFKPELSRLRDVVVFPSRGVFPLAERMQNGDYDGDRFWVCWEPAIVDKFENTPSPTDLPDPESLGIRVIDRIIDDTFTKADKEAIREFLNLNFDFRCQDDLLGICTDFRDRVVYWARSSKSAGVDVLDQLHDLLVDSSKMGYVFTEDKWRKFKSDHRLPRRYPDKPFYKQLLEGVSLERVKLPLQKNTIDRLFQDVIMPTADKIIAEVQLQWKCNSTGDDALCRPLRGAQQLAKEEPSHNKELKYLENEIATIYRTWMHWVSRSLKSETNTDSSNLGYMEMCYKEFRKLQPTTDFWRMRHETQILARSSPTDWDLLKASVVYFKYQEGAFSFRMAGRELGFLKAWSDGEKPRIITSLFYANMKPKRIKHITVQEDDTEE